MGFPQVLQRWLWVSSCSEGTSMLVVVLMVASESHVFFSINAVGAELP